jgi:radical SAM-linked protein
MVGDKFRIRFRKRGDLRFLSHLDLMRAFERMLRRAGLPFNSTSGFHPKPRMVFALSLPLGVAGLDEVVELELTEELPPEEVLTRLSAQAPAGMEFTSIRRIPPNATGQVCRAAYRLPVPQDRIADLADCCSALLAQAECWVERLHPKPKRVDVRPYILGLHIGEEEDRQSLPIQANSVGAGSACPPHFHLILDLKVTPTGSARAEELLGLLCLADLLDAGAILERTELQLHDEPAVDGLLPETRAMPLVHKLLEIGAADEGSDAPPDC